jgi:hypothetical protein
MLSKKSTSHSNNRSSHEFSANQSQSKEEMIQRLQSMNQHQQNHSISGLRQNPQPNQLSLKPKDQKGSYGSSLTFKTGGSTSTSMNQNSGG